MLSNLAPESFKVFFSPARPVKICIRRPIIKSSSIKPRVKDARRSRKIFQFTLNTPPRQINHTPMTKRKMKMEKNETETKHPSHSPFPIVCKEVPEIINEMDRKGK